MSEGSTVLEEGSKPFLPAVWRWVARWGAPTSCVATSVLLVVLIAPPSKLVTFIGSETWSRLGMGIVVFTAAYSVLIGVGLMTGKAVMPFGVSVENGGQPQVGLLSEELIRLRETDERVFERLGELNAVLAAALHRIQALEGGAEPS